MSRVKIPGFGREWRKRDLRCHCSGDIFLMSFSFLALHSLKRDVMHCIRCLGLIRRIIAQLFVFQESLDPITL